MMLRSTLALFVASICLAALGDASPAWADAASKPTVVFSPCSTTSRADEEKDATTVNTAVKQFQSGGFAALAQALPVLEQVMQHAPASGGMYEDCPAEVVLRSASLAEFLADSLRVVNAEKASGMTKPAVWRLSPYVRASLYLGSYNVETGALEKALVYLRHGLAISPADSGLTTEAANALTHLHQSEEALGLVDAALTSSRIFPETDRARLLRAKGYALGELARYDEAEDAYRESLKLQPGHVGAQNELLYLARMKSGAKPTQAVLMTGDKAATTSADAVLADKRKAAAAPAPKQP